MSTLPVLTEDKNIEMTHIDSVYGFTYENERVLVITDKHPAKFLTLPYSLKDTLQITAKLGKTEFIKVDRNNIVNTKKIKRLDEKWNLIYFTENIDNDTFYMTATRQRMKKVLEMMKEE